MKPRGEQKRDDTQRLEAAVDWMLRLRDEVASEADILRWMKWCEADPRNQQAFDRVEELWALSGGLENEVLHGDLIGAIDAPVPPQRTARGSHAVLASAWSAAVSALRAYGRPVAFGAASSAVIVLAALQFLRVDLAAPTVGDRDVVTGRPAELVREARLADGSTVQLAAKSTVSVNYSPKERALDLQGGEAFFSVVPNEDRPFVVAAGSVRVRAVGTAFNVRRADDRAVVTVTEGKVEIYRNAAIPAVAESGRGGAVTVSAGSQLRWGGGDPNPVLASVNPSASLAWRKGRLEYTDEPLGAVIADLNRYSDRPVTIRGDTIKSLRFSGTLLTNSTSEWLHALPSTLPVTVDTEADAYVIVPRSGSNSGDAR